MVKVVEWTGRIVPSTDPASPEIGERRPTSDTNAQGPSLHLSTSPSLLLPSLPPPRRHPPFGCCYLSIYLYYLLRVPWSGARASHQHPIVIWLQQSRVAVIPRPHPNQPAVPSVALASAASTWSPATRLHLLLAPPPTAAASASQGAQPYLRLDSALASHRPRLAPPSTLHF